MHDIRDTSRRDETSDRWRGVVAGVIAMMATITAILIAHDAFALASPFDALADLFLLILPMSMFSLTLHLFGEQAKAVMLAGLIFLLLAGGGIVGWRYALRTIDDRRVNWRAAIPGAAWVVVVLGAPIVLRQIPLENRIANQLTVTAGLLAVAAVIFAVTMVGSLTWLRQRARLAEEIAQTAMSPVRRLLTRAGIGAAALGSFVLFGRAISRVADRPLPAASARGTLSPAITSNEDFYIVSKNFVDPTPNRGENWSIAIDGVVERTLTLTRSDLERIAAPPFISTLACISNPVGGSLMSTAQWRGARLGDVLRIAGVGAGAVEVVFTGEDEYQDSIPLTKALAPETMLVWEMNGEPLPRYHGEPVRVIVPGRYGIKNVKWLTRITLANNDFSGYWQDRGWTDDGTVKTSSRFDIPVASERLSPGKHQIGGVAYAGDRGISRVEVSSDGGSTWQEATIAENPSPDGFSWVIWTMEWDANAGTFDLVVRATDGAGSLQSDVAASELPDGASGWHRIGVVVA